MFYSWQIGYRTLYDSTIDYDVVIRSRYDLGIYEPIDLNNIDFTKINHSSINSGFFDDNLCISNMENSNILFKNIFDDVVKYAKDLTFKELIKNGKNNRR